VFEPRYLEGTADHAHFLIRVGEKQIATINHIASSSLGATCSCQSYHHSAVIAQRPLTSKPSMCQRASQSIALDIPLYLRSWRGLRGKGHLKLPDGGEVEQAIKIEKKSQLSVPGSPSESLLIPVGSLHTPKC